MINIAELLKDAPKDLKLYSPICGHCKLSCILYDDDIRVIAHDVPFRFDKYGRFCSADDAECLLFPNKDCRTWEEWELPSKHKFKEGNWLYHNTLGVRPILVKSYSKTQGYKVECIRTTYYLQKDVIENEYHFWTIADANDGDVLVCYSEAKGSPIEQAGIFKQYVGRHGGCSNTFWAHTGIDWDGNIIINGYMGSTNILPATKEQRDLLFAKIKEAGYEWDADKKELRKIKPHYNIANFKPKQWVLVRQGEGCAWRLDVFSHLKEGSVCQFECVGNSMVQCIPFEGNENLLGTTDMCDEEFINW